MMRRRSAKDKELEDNARLLRAWRAWHRERLEAALVGPHGIAITELMTLLDRLELDSAAALLDCVQRMNWNDISYEVRLTVLHQINSTITRMRERHGMQPIDDPLPGAPESAFRIVKAIMTNSLR